MNIRYIFLLIVTANSLWANFDVQTSWIRSSLVTATGDVVDPDVENQSITGDPTTTYSEIYDKTVIRDDAGDINFAYLDYQIDTVSSAQGSVNSYSFGADVLSLSSINNPTGASTDFSFTSSTVFTTNTSFAVDALLLNGGQVNDLSLWVDDVMLWSSLLGLQGETDFNNMTEPLIAFDGVDTDFEMRLFASSEGTKYIVLEVLFGAFEPSHKFEIKTDWQAVEDTISIFDYDLNITPTLGFTIVPEVSQFWLSPAIFIYILGSRRRINKTS